MAIPKGVPKPPMTLATTSMDSTDTPRSATETDSNFDEFRLRPVRGRVNWKRSYYDRLRAQVDDFVAGRAEEGGWPGGPLADSSRGSVRDLGPCYGRE